MDLPRPVAAVPVLIAYGVLDEATAAVWIGLALPVSVSASPP